MKNLLFVIVLILISSCGTRKKETAEKKARVETEFSGISRNSENSHEILIQDSNIFKSSSTKKEDTNETQTEETCIEPSDPTKPALYTDPSGKKHVLDNVKLTTKKSNSKSQTNSGNSENSQELLKATAEKKLDREANAKATVKQDAKRNETELHLERKTSRLWDLLWLLIPVILIFLIVALWKKYKNINPLA